MRKWFIGITLLLTAATAFLFKYQSPAGIAEPPPVVVEMTELPAVEEESAASTLYGIDVQSKVVIEDVVKPNENLSSILSNYEVPLQEIDLLAKRAKGIFDVRKINAHKSYKLICSTDSVAQFMIYEPNKIEYVVFDLNDTTNVYVGHKEVVTVEKTLSGIIKTSLYNAMIEGGASPVLVDNMADVFGWQLDFGRLQVGDKYKVIYEQNLVDGESAGLGPILGAEFTHENNPFYAVRYNQGNGPDYFDEKGHSLRKAFLRYPVKFTRISSRYSGRRFHPVLKRYKSHRGTDYAAPTGTPIRAAGDGIISEARYNGGNGNYVKIRHNSTYSTQYLHMSRIASGVKPGVKVTQGQTIGYVGSTGLANGPHLCYRFWKNGVQVDALKVELPPSEPIHEDSRVAYDTVMMSMLEQLQNVVYPNEAFPILAGD
ncbi:MAG: peptidoglycan DD-metalloendopeptidase family protein [Cyclobacteriaceae bacterium]|nr:peptidoglycan DD-metalloendopeptidase family protein [Cyclobacteriaceae bacterium]